jgi:type IV pilus biogenesis protein CpaD/CtpE
VPRRVRQARATAGLVALLAVLAVILASCISSGSSTTGTAPQRGTAAHPVVPAVESGLLPWKLRAPLSREVASPDRTAG